MKTNNGIKQPFLKIAISILFTLVISTQTICQAQTRDSICIHTSMKNYQWLGIRHMDTAGVRKYRLNTKYFEKFFFNDSLNAKYIGPYCIPASLFVGEYTTPDSIHFIDFLNAKSMASRIHLHIGDICNNYEGANYISRNQLPQLQKLTLISADSVKLLGYDLTIDTGSTYATFQLGEGEFPKEAQNYILRLREGQVITVDKIHLLFGKRSVYLPSLIYQVKE